MEDFHDLADGSKMLIAENSTMKTTSTEIHEGIVRVERYAFELS
jgi:hypothetical protein